MLPAEHDAGGDFTITVTGDNPSPNSFVGKAGGTTITLGPGDFQVSESPANPIGFSFSGDCDQRGKGTIADGNTKQCTLTNTVAP